MRVILICAMLSIFHPMRLFSQAGNCLDFDGRNDYVLIEQDESLEPANFTVEAWISPGRDYDRGDGLIPVFVTIQNSRHPCGGYNLYWDSRGNQGNLSAFLSVGEGNFNGMTFQMDLDEDEWYHFAFTHDGENQVLYADGEDVAFMNAEGDLNPSGRPMTFGVAPGEGNTSYEGRLDEVRIWDYARSARDISENMGRILSGDEEGLVSYWNFNEGEGDDLEDQTENENHGAISGASWEESDAPIRKYGILEVDVDSVQFGMYEIDGENINQEIVLTNSSSEEIGSELEFNIEFRNGNPGWLSFEPDEGTLEPGEDQIVEIAIQDNEVNFGTYSTIVEIVSSDLPLEPINLYVEITFIEGWARLFGTVYDQESEEPISGIEVHIDNGEFATTDEEGFYSFDRLNAGEHEILVDLRNSYLPFLDILELGVEEELEFDIPLRFAWCDLLTDDKILELYEDSTFISSFIVGNSGNGTIYIELEPIVSNEDNVDPWELRHTINIGNLTEDHTLQGIEFDGNYFYVSGSVNYSDQNKIYVINEQGELEHSFEQPQNGRWGVWDMAWDGFALWAGNDSTIFRISTDGEILDTLDGVIPLNRALTWHDDLLWVSDKEADIVAIDSSGEEQYRYERDPLLEIFGLATYPYDPDGYYIYAFCSDGNYETQINKMKPENGDWLFVTDLETEIGIRAGGACISRSWESSSWVFAGLLRGNDEDEDELGIWQLGSRAEWLRLDVLSAAIAASHEQEFFLEVDATDFTFGDVMQADILINHNGRNENPVFNITMQVNLGTPKDIHLLQSLRHFSVSAMYPNPFNEITMFTVNIPTNMVLDIGIYTLTGQRVSTLHSGKIEAGSQELSFDASGYPSGIYIIKATSDGTTITRKALLLR